MSGITALALFWTPAAARDAPQQSFSTASTPDAISQAVAQSRLLTWNQAMAIGHPALDGWEKPEGMPLCASANLSFSLAPTEEPRDDAPECYLPPEKQEIYLPPPSAGKGGAFLDDELAPGGYRFGGSRTQDGYVSETVGAQET